MEPQLATRDSTPDSDFSSKAQDGEVDPAAKKRVIHKRGGSGPEIQRRPPKDESLDDKRGSRDNRVRGDAKRTRGGDAPVKSRSEREAREGSKGDAARAKASRDRSDRSDRPNPRGDKHGDKTRGDTSRRDGRRSAPGGREGPRGDARGDGRAAQSPGREPDAPPARVGGERNEHGTRVARRIECHRCGAVDHSQWVEQKNDHALCRECAEELLGVLELGRKEKHQTRREVCNLCGVPFDLPTFVKDDGDLLCGGCIRGFMGWKGTLDREYEDRIGDVSESVRPGLRVRRRQGGPSVPEAETASEPADGVESTSDATGAALDTSGESSGTATASAHVDTGDAANEVADATPESTTEDHT